MATMLPSPVSITRSFAQSGLLYVEVSLRKAARKLDGDDWKTKLADMIKDAMQRLDYVRLGQADLDDLMLPSEFQDVINSIRYDYSGPPQDEDRFEPKSMRIEIRPFVLHAINEQPRGKSTMDNDNVNGHSRVMVLPNSALDGLWSGLIFEDNLHVQLLRILVKGTRGPTSNTEDHLARCRICLLHGPPGSGKSVTCRALAQKLSIQSGYPEAVLVELSATSLFSKYFGETSRLVEEFFDEIAAFAKNPSRLVCVIVDEVDAIGGKRAAVQNECRDDARATISLLTGLDRIRSLNNVIFFATTNIINALDPAFLDRTNETLSRLVSLPSTKVIYEMLRRGVSTLEQQGLVKGVSSWPESNLEEAVTHLSWDTDIPQWETMLMYFRRHPQSIPCRLWKIAQACEGKSARKVSVLPLKAFDTELEGEESTLSNVQAMERLVGIKK